MTISITSVITGISVKEVFVEFSFDNNYTSIVAYNKSGFINHIIPQLARSMGIQEKKIIDLEVKAGELCC